MFDKLCERPRGLTEVRRDGKDNDSVIRVIKKEFDKCQENGIQGEKLQKHMEIFASACWVSQIWLQIVRIIA